MACLACVLFVCFIYQPGRALLVTGVLFIIVILIFATLGFILYGTENFCEGGDCEMPPRNLYDTFWLVLDGGIRYKPVEFKTLKLRFSEWIRFLCTRKVRGHWWPHDWYESRRCGDLPPAYLFYAWIFHHHRCVAL